MGIKPFAVINMNHDLFVSALNMGVINEEQLEMINKFTADPDNTMAEFLKNHPEFLEASLSADEKTVVRARLCIESGFYGLK